MELAVADGPGAVDGNVDVAVDQFFQFVGGKGAAFEDIAVSFDFFGHFFVVYPAFSAGIDRVKNYKQILLTYETNL